jgi:D-alanyl-lipoteichoic acid acyltransferase DltB (MBOAT superfamily)
VIDAVSFLAFIVFWVGLSEILGTRNRWVRLVSTTAPGAIFLFIAHPRALALAIGTLAFSSAIYAVGYHAENKRLRTRLPYAILLLLFLPDFIGLFDESPVLWLGSAFFIVRQMMTVAQSLKQSVTPTRFAPSLLLATFFFAALPSGPVFNGVKVWDELGERKDPVTKEGVYRLFEGFVFLFAVAGFAGSAIGQIDANAGELDPVAIGWLLVWIIKPLVAFLFLFSTFYGYSRMAEGTALLFGFTVPQNFNRPHLATDLSDYWRRWHRSMADFVMQYIYLPLLVTTRQAKVALLAAFVFMGIWHVFSIEFFAWGVGHGVGLGVVLPWAQTRLSPAAIRLGSLIWVIALSSLAHQVWTG